MHGYKSLICYVAAVLVVAVVFLVSPISGATVWQLFPGFEAVAHANPFGTALIFLAASALFAFLAFPSMPMVYMAAGFYMGGYAGGATVLLGSTFGCLGAFLFYRKHLLQRPSASLHRQSPMKIWLTLLGLRLSPLVPSPLVNLFSAAFDISPLQYLTTSALGSAPLVMFYAQIGQNGHHFLSGEALHWQQFSGYLIILTLSTLLSAMGPWRSILNDLRRQLKGSSEAKTLTLHSATGM